jgi:hypothetical protein
LTATEYGNELAAEMADEDPALTQAYERCVVLLNLVKPGDLSIENRVGVSTSTVPASYNTKTKQVTFVVPDDQTPAYRKESAYIVLAHEYVHALQDQEVDLGQFEKDYVTSTDSALATHCLVEGEAVTHENRYLAANWGLDPSDLDWDARYAASRAYDEELLAGVAPLLAIWRSLPYVAGGPYVRRAFESGGMPAVRALFANPPTATATVTSGVEPIAVVAEPPAPPVGYEVFDVDSFGAELLYDFLRTVPAIASTDANRLAADWRGDRIYFYRNPSSNSVALVWRLRFATPALGELMLAVTNSWRSIAVGGDVVIALTTDLDRTAVLDALLNNVSSGINAPPSGPTDGSPEAARPWRLFPLVKRP